MREAAILIVNSFEIVDHGINHISSLKSCEARDPFAYVATGVGDNPAEAFDDCLEQISKAGWASEDVGERVLKRMERDVFPEHPSVKMRYADPEGIYYCVSICWNGG